VLLDFWLRREITQHFVLGEKFCQLFLQSYLSLFSCLHDSYAANSFKHCRIRMKINAGPSGRKVISLQKVDSLLVFLNVTGSWKVLCKVGSLWFGLIISMWWYWPW
jgi:hypothetical protein